MRHHRAPEGRIGFFGMEVRHFREEKGVSQAVAARAMGMSTSYLCDIEKGRSMPPRETISQIAQYLDIHPDYLLFVGGYVSLDLMPDWIDNHGRSVVRNALDGVRTMLLSEERYITCN